MQASHSLNRELQATFAAELAALERFGVMLQQEQQLLLDNQADELQQLARQKIEIVQAVNVVAEERGRLFRACGLSLDADAEVIFAHLSQRDAVLAQQWQQLLQQALQLQQQNNLNGDLIKLRLRANQQALAILDGAPAGRDLYGPNGQRNFVPGAGRPLAKG